MKRLAKNTREPRAVSPVLPMPTVIPSMKRRNWTSTNLERLEPRPVWLWHSLPRGTNGQHGTGATVRLESQTPVHHATWPGGTDSRRGEKVYRDDRLGKGNFVGGDVLRCVRRASKSGI